MSRKSLQEIASQTVHALWQRKVFTQTALAKRMDRPLSMVNGIVHGKRPITLKVLEAVSDLAAMHPAELLVESNEALKILSPPEAQILRYFRSWPAPTKAALLTFASFFADEDPVTHEQHVAHEQLRRLGEAKRRLAYAYLTFLTEGDLPRDVRIALGLPETDAPPETHSGRVKRRTTPKKTA